MDEREARVRLRPHTLDAAGLGAVARDDSGVNHA